MITNKDEINHNEINKLILAYQYTSDDIATLNKFFNYSIQDIIATLELHKTSNVLVNKIALAEIYNVPLRIILEKTKTFILFNYVHNLQVKSGYYIRLTNNDQDGKNYTG